MRPSWHTLSNALDISKNTSQTLYPTSKDLHITWVVHRSRLVHESCGLNQDWFGEIRPFILTKLYILLYTDARAFYCRSEAMRLGNDF